MKNKNKFTLFLYLGFILIFFQGFGQITSPPKKIELNYVEFIDTAFRDDIALIIRRYDNCFHSIDTFFYTISFFQSPFLNKDYFIIFDLLKEEDVELMHYYINIEGVNFIFSEIIPEKTFHITSQKKIISWNCDNAPNYEMIFIAHYSTYAPHILLVKICDEFEDFIEYNY